MSDAGLQVDVVDLGFDFSIGDEADATIARFDIGPILMEVKATTHEEVRMTPLQAQTASVNSNRYVLCVVKLPNAELESLDEAQRRQIVAETARVVCDIGDRTAPTTALVDEAIAQEVSIRNEGYLRYGVTSGIWNKGPRLADWILAAFPRTGTATPTD